MNPFEMGFEYQMEAIGLIVGVVVFIEGISWAIHEEYGGAIRWNKRKDKRLMTSYPNMVAE